MSALALVEFSDECPTALYRCYDAPGRLLYVGVTGNLGRRMRAHEKRASWWSSATRKTVSWYPSRVEALRAEQAAISDENPVCNIQRPRPGKALRPARSPRAAKAAVKAYTPRSLRVAKARPVKAATAADRPRRRSPVVLCDVAAMQRARLDAGLEVADVAYLVNRMKAGPGIAAGTLWRMENPRKRERLAFASPELLSNIARALRVPVAAIMREHAVTPEAEPAPEDVAA